MENKKIEGVVDAINSKTRTGIKIGENWYNATKITKEYISKIEKGDRVEIDVNDEGQITFVKILGKSNGIKTTVTNPYSTKAIELSPEEKKVVLKETVEKYNEIMTLCKISIDSTIGKDEKYKEFLGQHVNSLFIAVDRTLREKGIRL